MRLLSALFATVAVGACFMGAMPVQKAALSNGIPVFLQEDHSTPLVSVLVVVATGSANETADTSGLSHFLEHLLFDGTATQTRPQIQDRFDSKGIYANAFTRDDYTAFVITAPKEYLADGVANLADMLLNSTLPDSEFPKERNVVIEEMKRTRDNAFSLLEDAFRTHALKGTPYERPTLGVEQVISRAPRETVLAYYKAHYKADSFSIVAVGDFDALSVLRVLNDHFGNLPRSGAGSLDPPFALFSPKGRALVETTGKTPAPYLSIAFPAPDPGTSDAIAMDLLASALNNPESAVAAALTAGKKPLASSFQADYSGYRRSAFFEVDVALTGPSSAKPALNALVSALQSLAQTPVSGMVLERLRVTVRADFAFNNENYTYAAMNLAQEVGPGRFLSPDDYLNQVNRTTTADLQRVAASYFGGGNYRAVLLTPEA
ncbi:MAG: M16 family metallopeptidase, partial [bacterium]